MKRLLGAALCAALVAGGAAAAAPLPPPVDYHVRVLANGLKVYSVFDPTRPKVSVQVWYGAGSRNDPPGRSGLAHLVEHLMFDGRGEAPEGFLDAITESTGGDSNASTNHDFAEYHDTVPPADVEAVLWAEAARMARLDISRADLDGERTVVERELLEAAADGPHSGSLLAWDLPKAGLEIPLEPDSTIGTIRDLQRVTPEDVRRFHDLYYRPDNAAVVVVGAFDRSRLDPWVQRYFGAIPSRDRVNPPGGDPSRPAPRVDVAAHPARGRAVAAVLGFAAPPADSADAPALTVLDELLTGSDAAYGYTRLVDRGLAEDVFSGADLRRRSGVFVFGAVCGRAGCHARIGRGLRAVLAELRARPVNASALQTAKNQLLAEALQARETATGLGAEIGRAVTVEGDASHVNSDVGAVARVSAADVQRVARRYLADDQGVFVRLRGEPPRAERAVPPAAAQAPDTRRVIAAAPARLPVAVAHSAAAGVVAPEVEEKVLANGLRVVVSRSGHLPLATATLIVGRAGGLAGPDAAALNRIAADVSLFGCGRSASAVASRYEALGLTAATRFDGDSARLSLTGLSSSMAAGLQLLARCVRAEPPRGARFEALRQDLAASEGQPQADVDALADAALDRLAFAAGGLKRPAHGSSTPPRIGRAEVLRWRGRLFRPGAATLVMTGDVAPAQAFRLAEALFGSWSATAKGADAVVPEPTTLPGPVVVVNAPGYPLALIAIGARTPGHADRAHLAYALADCALGGSFTSRLNQVLRAKRSLTYAVSSQIDWRRNAGLFTARAEVDPAVAPDVAALMVGAVDELAQTGPTGDELARAKALVSGEFADAPETTEDLADLLSAQAARGEPLGQAFADPARLPALDARDVQAAAVRLADPRNLHVVIVADVRRLPASFRRRLAPGAVVDADALFVRSD